MQLDEFVAMLDGANDRLDKASFREALERAGKQFGQEVQRNFERQEDSSGTPWKPHAPLTIALHGVHPLLRLTYAMYQAATDLDAAGSTKLLKERSIMVGIDGTEIPYAIKQDEGAGRIPAREFFYLSEEGAERVQEVIEEELGPIVEGFVLKG